ncbi:hypothetical protein F8S09_14200 [Deinococcus sp. SDU3-2]|uniref:Uncharacterized protein n=1 Tax=Deinococcus terrestris TaxID=2651870 RepID=A0A7X1NXZ6_9DEIO|nr:hypothetical protein [Deinococcus terrestris]MPY67820.1 hypothetical protein [Deinococcus terrestris]
MHDAENPNQVFLRLNGLPSDHEPPPDETFFFLDGMGQWKIHGTNLDDRLQSVASDIHIALEAIFLNDAKAYLVWSSLPTFILGGGFHADVAISRDSFTKMINIYFDSINDNEQMKSFINSFMYLSDLQRLVSNIQECNDEISQLRGEFYRSLNLDDLRTAAKDGVVWLRNPTTTRIHANLGFIYIRMYSLLDYITKLMYEVQHFHSDFSTYPVMKSTKIQFGDKKKVDIDQKYGTVFGKSDTISEIETLRHHLIHDGFFDEFPRVYIRFDNSIQIEKFILMPDMISGRLTKFKNRRLFYGSEVKWNLRLPALIADFQLLQVNTLLIILENLRNLEQTLARSSK